MHTRVHAIGSRSTAAPCGDDDKGSTEWKRGCRKHCGHVVILLALVATGCGGSAETPPSHESVAAIYSNIGGELFGDDSIQVQAYPVGFRGDSIPGLVVKISALTPALATLSTTGVIHVRGTGLAEFAASTDGLTDTIALQVFATRIARIIATPDSAGLVVGQQFDTFDPSAPFRLHAIDPFGNEMQGVRFFLRSSKSQVVRVDDYRDEYEVVAAGVGTDVITASADTTSTTVKVTVTPSP